MIFEVRTRRVSKQRKVSKAIWPHSMTTAKEEREPLGLTKPGGTITKVKRLYNRATSQQTMEIYKIALTQYNKAVREIKDGELEEIL